MQYLNLYLSDRYYWGCSNQTDKEFSSVWGIARQNQKIQS